MPLLQRKLFALGLLALLLRPAAAAEFDAAIPFPDLRKVAVHLWVPDDAAPLESLVVLLPGFNGDWRMHTADAAWQAFATAHHCGLLGCFLAGDGYARASLWSGKAFLQAVDAVARQAGRPELGRAPLLLWGFSAGGQFNFNFAAWQPQRVAAFLVNKGAYYDPPGQAAVERVPGLFVAGANDTDLRKNNIARLCADGRRRGALWSFALEPGHGHDVGNTEELGRVFFASVLARRATDSLSPSEPWIGQLDDHAIRSFEAGHGDGTRTDLAWLPDRNFAQAWQAFVGGTAEGRATAASDPSPASAEKEPEAKP